jgi:hypothetical protein
MYAQVERESKRRKLEMRKTYVYARMARANSFLKMLLQPCIMGTFHLDKM